MQTQVQTQVQIQAVAQVPPPLRLLSLDDGDVRGGTLEILQALRNETGFEPYETFDMICGTGSGGIVALLHGALKIPIDECCKIFHKMPLQMFDSESFKQSSGRGTVVEKTALLERFFKNTIRDKCGDENLLLDKKTGSPRVFVVSTSGDITSGEAWLFRNYDDVYAGGTYGVKVWEAARATSAVPGIYDGIAIDDSRYVAGCIGGNSNPAHIMWMATKRISVWRNRPVGCIVSVGCGVPPTIPANVKTQKEDLARRHAEFARDCKRVHEELDGGGVGPEEKGIYFRFNVPVGSTAQQYLGSQSTVSLMKSLAEKLPRGRNAAPASPRREVI